MRSFAYLCSLASLLLVATPAVAQALYAGNTIAYQGRLELDGQPVITTVSMTFRFYPTADSTTELGSFTADVTPAAGNFALDIGPLPDAVFASDELWLSLEVGGNALGGRQRVVAAPRAARADTAGELTVTGTAVVVGNTESNGLEVGYMGHDGWAGAAHTGAAGPDGYALLQNTNGSQTLLNAAAGGTVRVRTGNSDRVIFDSNGNVDVTGGVRVQDDLAVEGTARLGYVRRQCNYPSGAQHGDCSCASGERVISGGSYVETQQNQPGHIDGFIHHRKGFWLRESRPMDDVTWRVACMEIQYISVEGDNDDVVDLEVRPTNCGAIDIVCARVAN